MNPATDTTSSVPTSTVPTAPGGRRPSRRHVLAAMASATAGSLLLAACGSDSSSADSSSSGDSDAKTTISILAPSYTDTSQADWQTIIKGFTAKHPNVTVKLQIEAWDGFTDKVQARVQGNDAPDILNDNNFAGYATGKALYPITEVMSASTLKSIEPALLKNGKGEDGTQWAAPDIASARILAYNTDLFARAGVAKAPTTWDELADAATKISALGGGIYGYGMPLGQEEAQVESSLWVWGGGGDWTSGTKITVDTPANEAAFTEMKSLITAGVTQPDAGSTGREAVAALFNQGKLGMYVTHPGLAGVTRQQFPDVRFALAPVPGKTAADSVALGVTDFIEAFDNGDADRKAATKLFLDYFYSPDVYATWAKNTGLLPVTTAAIAASAASDTANKPFYDALPTVRFLPQGNPHWSTLQSSLQSNAGQIGSQSAKQVLSTIAGQVAAG